MAGRLKAQLQKPVIFFKENFGVSIAFFFLFVVGVAAGISIIQAIYFDTARFMVNNLSVALLTTHTPWLRCLLLAFSTHMLVIAFLLLAGSWVPASPLWCVAILLRGMLVGVGIGAGSAAWPSRAALWVILFFQLDLAIMIPFFLRTCVCTSRQISWRCTKMMRDKEMPEDTGLSAFVRAASGLVICAVLEGIALPLAIRLFG